jgi:hypothetical protein
MRVFIALFGALSVWLTTTADVPVGDPVHGIKCEAMEGSVLHIHQHLAIYDHGKPVGIPADVGRPIIAGCFYWLHTHTPDGIIHVESPTFRTYTLGDFFDVWGQPLSRADVAGAKPRAGEAVVVWVDGHRFAGNPRTIELTEHLDVTIDVGPPARRPVPYTDWAGL